MTIIQHYITGLYIMGLNSLIFIDTLLKRQRFLQTATKDRKKENMQSLKLSEKMQAWTQTPRPSSRGQEGHVSDDPV